MNVAAQAVAVRAVVAPQGFFENFPAQNMRAFLHQHGEQFQAHGVELEQAPFAGDFQRIEVVVQVTHLQGTTPATLGTAQHRFDTRSQFRQGEGFEQVVIGAAIQAAQAVDTAIGRIEAAVRATHGALLITADHGNLEMMRDPQTGQPHTAHTVGPVPLVYVGGRPAALRGGGALRDIAPTLLDLLGLPQPAEMSGRSLLLPT